MKRSERNKDLEKELENLEAEESEEISKHDQEELDEYDEIDNDSTKIRYFGKKIIITIFLLVILLLVGYIIIRYVANYGIIVREYPAYSNKINYDFNGTKIVQFGDINYNEYRKNVEEMVSKINLTNTDYVIFTGDLVNKNYSLTEKDKTFLINELTKIKASNKYAIKGETDKEDFTEIFTNSDFTILEPNTVYNIYSKESYMNLLVLNDNITPILLDDEIYNIILTHNPKNIDNILNYYHPDLILAGHNLNGGIYFPINKSKYTNTYYKINNTDIYITGGIGNHKYEFRLFNNPSINFYRLRTSK